MTTRLERQIHTKRKMHCLNIPYNSACIPSLIRQYPYHLSKNIIATTM